VKIRLLLAIFIFIFSRSVFADNADDPSTLLKVWVSVAPLHYLSDATITVQDAKGRIVGTGKTNNRGRSDITVTNASSIRFPLKITSSGGYDQGTPFRGHVRAKTFSIGAMVPSVKLDLMSTAATILSGAGRDYNKSLASVRKTLGIGTGAPDYVIQVWNIHIDEALLKARERLNGGFNGVVNAVARSAMAGKRYFGLEPITANNPPRKPSLEYIKKMTAHGVTAHASSPVSSVCTPPVGNGQASASSTELITEIGVVGMETLGEYAGVPGPVNSYAAGTVLGYGTNQQDPTAEALAAIQEQLTCISQQIAYLSEQVTYLSVQVSLNNAQDCGNKLDTAWQTYLDGMNSADVYPLNENNTSFINQWLPNWNETHNACGSAINTALFSSNGGVVPAWPTLVSTYQNKRNGVVYQSEVQEMQEFLAYWSEKEHQQFIMRSEYDSYYGYYQDRDVISGFDINNPDLCEKGVTSTSAKFCVWSNNIKAAYPKDLYSDEIGIMSSGYGVNSYPSELNAYKILDAYCNSYAWGANGQQFFDEFNSRPLNTSETDTAIETWSNPRAYRDQKLYRNDLTSFGAYSNELTSFYLTSINSDPNTLWKSLSASDVSFGALDAVASIQYIPGDFGIGSLYVYDFQASLNNKKSKSHQAAGCKDPLGVNGNPHPTLGYLLGRVWWPGSSSASTYQPPPPPTAK
jgi:hypothetical protein